MNNEQLINASNGEDMCFDKAFLINDYDFVNNCIKINTEPDPNLILQSEMIYRKKKLTKIKEFLEKYNSQVNIEKNNLQVNTNKNKFKTIYDFITNAFYQIKIFMRDIIDSIKNIIEFIGIFHQIKNLLILIRETIKQFCMIWIQVSVLLIFLKCFLIMVGTVMSFIFPECFLTTVKPVESAIIYNWDYFCYIVNQICINCVCFCVFLIIINFF